MLEAISNSVRYIRHRRYTINGRLIPGMIQYTSVEEQLCQYAFGLLDLYPVLRKIY